MSEAMIRGKKMMLTNIEFVSAYTVSPLEILFFFFFSFFLIMLIFVTENSLHEIDSLDNETQGWAYRGDIFVHNSFHNRSLSGIVQPPRLIVISIILNF